MAKAISYIRFSSSKQETGDSLKRQQGLINDWLNKNSEVELSNMSFKDLGLSGYHGSHLKHDFGRLLDAIEANKIKSGDYILVEAIDRIGRLDTLTALNIITSICMKGVKIITLEDNQEYSSEVVSSNAGLIYYLIGKIDMAHQYSKNLARRINSVWDDKREQASNGKMVKRKSFWWITRNESSGMFDIVTPKDKALIQAVVRLFLSGSSYTDLVNHVKNDSPERFKTTSHAAIRQWLKSRTLMGFWQDSKIYPEVITTAEFYLLQDEINKRKNNRTKGKSSGHIMAGLVKCALCGGNYSVRQHAHSQTTMFCTKAKRAGNQCENTKSIPMPIAQEFRRLNQLGYIYRIMNDDIQLEIEDSIIQIDANIKDLSKRQKRILKAIEATDDESLYTRLSELKKEIEALEIEKRNVSINSKTKFELLKKTSQALNGDMEELMNDDKRLNGLLKSVDFVITGNNGKLEIGSSSLEYVKYKQREQEYVCIDESYKEVIIKR